jgi:hypothetical protein
MNNKPKHNTLMRELGIFGATMMPLEIAARTIGTPGLETVIAIGACTSMLGVLLNLILSLSHVALENGCGACAYRDAYSRRV